MPAKNFTQSFFDLFGNMQQSLTFKIKGAWLWYQGYPILNQSLLNKIDQTLAQGKQDLQALQPNDPTLFLKMSEGIINVFNALIPPLKALSLADLSKLASNDPNGPKKSITVLGKKIDLPKKQYDILLDIFKNAAAPNTELQNIFSDFLREMGIDPKNIFKEDNLWFLELSNWVLAMTQSDQSPQTFSTILTPILQNKTNRAALSVLSKTIQEMSETLKTHLQKRDIPAPTLSLWNYYSPPEEPKPYLFPSELFSPEMTDYIETMGEEEKTKAGNLFFPIEGNLDFIKTWSIFSQKFLKTLDTLKETTEPLFYQDNIDALTYSAFLNIVVLKEDPDLLEAIQDVSADFNTLSLYWSESEEVSHKQAKNDYLANHLKDKQFVNSIENRLNRKHPKHLQKNEIDPEIILMAQKTQAPAIELLNELIKLYKITNEPSQKKYVRSEIIAISKGLSILARNSEKLTIFYQDPLKQLAHLFKGEFADMSQDAMATVLDKTTQQYLADFYSKPPPASAEPLIKTEPPLKQPPIPVAASPIPVATPLVVLEPAKAAPLASTPIDNQKLQRQKIQAIKLMGRERLRAGDLWLDRTKPLTLFVTVCWSGWNIFSGSFLKRNDRNHQSLINALKIIQKTISTSTEVIEWKNAFQQCNGDLIDGNIMKKLNVIQQQILPRSESVIKSDEFPQNAPTLILREMSSQKSDQPLNPTKKPKRTPTLTPKKK